MWCSSISFGGQLLFIIYECGCHLLDSDWDRRIQIIPYNPIDGYWKPVRNLSMVPKRSHKCRCMSWNIPWLMVTGLWIEHKSRVVFISHVLWRNDVHKDLISVAFLPYDKRIYELTGKCFWFIYMVSEWLIWIFCTFAGQTFWLHVLLWSFRTLCAKTLSTFCIVLFEKKSCKNHHGIMETNDHTS